jgi:hypothetical protein
VRAFVATSGLIFAMIFAAHIARLLFEGAGPLRDPVFIVSSLASFALVIWAAILVRRSKVELQSIKDTPRRLVPDDTEWS